MAHEFGSWFEAHLKQEGLQQKEVAATFVELAATHGHHEWALTTAEPLVSRLKSGDEDARRFFLGDPARLRWFAQACRVTPEGLAQRAPAAWRLAAMLDGIPVVVVDATAVAAVLRLRDPVDAAARVEVALRSAVPPVRMLVFCPAGATQDSLGPPSQRQLLEWRNGGVLLEPAEGEGTAATEVRQRRERGEAATLLGGDATGIPHFYRMRAVANGNSVELQPPDFATRLRNPVEPAPERRPLPVMRDFCKVVVHREKPLDRQQSLDELPSEVRVPLLDFLAGHPAAEVCVRLEESGCVASERSYGRDWVSPSGDRLYHGALSLLEDARRYRECPLAKRREYLPDGSEALVSHAELRVLLGLRELSSQTWQQTRDTSADFRSCLGKAQTLRLLAMHGSQEPSWWECADGMMVVHAKPQHLEVCDPSVVLATPVPETTFDALLDEHPPFTLLPTSEEPARKGFPNTPNPALLRVLPSAGTDLTSALVAAATVHRRMSQWARGTGPWCVLWPAEVREVLCAPLAGNSVLTHADQDFAKSWAVPGSRDQSRLYWNETVWSVGQADRLFAWLDAVRAFLEFRRLAWTQRGMAILAHSLLEGAFTFRGARYPHRPRQPVRLFHLGQDALLADAGDLVLDVRRGEALQLPSSAESVEPSPEFLQAAAEWAQWEDHVPPRGSLAGKRRREEAAAAAAAAARASEEDD